MKFYAEKTPELRIIIWNVYDDEPVYDGPISGSLEVFSEYSKKTDIPEHDEESLRAAKKKYVMMRCV